MDFKLLPHEVVHHDGAFRVNVTDAEIPSGVRDVLAKSMWDQGYKGQGIVIAIIDTGCVAHQDLKGQIIGGRNFTKDYNGDVNNYADNNFHGTHVAGTIAAVEDGSGVVGVAPKAKLLILKAMDSKGYGGFSEVTNAIDYAMNWVGPNGEKVRIISMSIASAFTTPLMAEKVKAVEAAGIALVCSAGNNGDGNADTDERNFPAFYPQAIAVTSYNMWGGISDYSASNANIDVAAPGDNIWSTNHLFGYSTATGTSMAAPHVAGALALIANKLDAAHGRKVTGSEMYEFLVNHHTIALDVPKTLQGYGAIRFINATTPVFVPPPPPVTPPVDEPSPVVPPAPSSFEATLQWLSSPVTPGGPPLFSSVDYWRENAVAGKTVKGDLVQAAFKKIYAAYGK